MLSYALIRSCMLYYAFIRFHALSCAFIRFHMLSYAFIRFHICFYTLLNAFIYVFICSMSLLEEQMMLTLCLTGFCSAEAGKNYWMHGYWKIGYLILFNALLYPQSILPTVTYKIPKDSIFRGILKLPLDFFLNCILKEDITSKGLVIFLQFKHTNISSKELSSLYLTMSPLDESPAIAHGWHLWFSHRHHKAKLQEEYVVNCLITFQFRLHCEINQI